MIHIYSLHFFKKIVKLLTIFLFIFSLFSVILYSLVEPKKNKNWTLEHSVLPTIIFHADSETNPTITVNNIRDFKWQSEKNITKKHAQYKVMQFQLENISTIKAVVSHFSPISEIAHVFLIVVLDDGRELGISIEARREVEESFSIHGGLLAQFEIMHVLATPEDLLSIRKINNESVHIYPIKVTREKAQELFTLIAKDVNELHQNPALYHLLFKNCTNQIVKHVSILTDQKYPWFFQTMAPGNTGKTLYDFNLIDLPNLSFKEVQTKTLIH